MRVLNLNRACLKIGAGSLGSDVRRKMGGIRFRNASEGQSGRASRARGAQELR